MKNVLAGVLLSAAFAAIGAEPRVGVTIALRNGFGHQQYISNAHFKTRPVVRELAKEGLDLCWYEGWGKGEGERRKEKGGESADAAVNSLKQFNAIWILTDHEDECPYTPEEVGEALKAYVEQGGGLVVSHSAGRYPEAPVDAFWKKALSVFGMEILHEEVSDLTEKKHDVSVYVAPLFYAANLSDHPVAKGVAGAWLPMRGGYPSHCWAVPAVKYSADWTPVLSTGPNGASYAKNRRTNFVEWDDANRGTYAKGPVPIVAARTFGRGRVVFSSIHKDNSGWMFGIDKWPNVQEKGELFGRRSDTLKILENALAWVSEPSLADGTFARGYVPVEPKEPPYVKVDAGPTPDEKPVWKPITAANRVPGAIGLVGLHSNLSDGESSVAEYVAEAKRLGLSFLIFTDDLAKLTDEKLQALRRQCAANSSDDFYCCPGVEFVDMDGLKWITYHDKIEFPKKDFLRDGRIYEVMKDGILRQRNFYGHQNLYRGAVLNTEQFEKQGIDPENLADFNGVVPKAYDLDREEYDNIGVNKRIAANLHLCMAVSFTRVRRASGLARAKAASVTCADSLAGVRAATGNKGAVGWREAKKAHLRVACGGAIDIRDFTFVRVPGTDLFQAAVRAMSPDGLSELLVDDDGGTRVLARFDAGGKTDFAATFAFHLSRQTHPCLTVRDRAGHVAVATAERLSYPHAGINRCSDNANLLSSNPNVLFSNNWDDHLMPCYKFLCEPPGHFHGSEAFFWESYGRNPTRLPSSRVASEFSPIRMKGIDYPSEPKGLMPSSRFLIDLIAPNSVAIFEQIQGEKIMTPTRGPDRATYGFGPLPVKVGEGRYWRRRHRVYQFTDRIDSWWRAVWQRVVPEYRGGYAICEGEIEFTEDVELAGPVPLCRIETANPGSCVEVWRTSGDLVRGSYYGTVGNPNGWYAWFGLGDSDPLSVREERKGADRLVSELTVGDRRVYRKGEKIRYRFAMGTFNEPPKGGHYLEWIRGMLDGSGFTAVAKRGTIDKVDGLLMATAKDGACELELGPTWFIQDYPVRISGLVDNGTAFAVIGGKLFRPLGFDGKFAYVEVPLEKKSAWWFGNLFLADDPALRFCYLPAMEGHPEAELQIHNPTDRTIAATVRDVRSGETFRVSVPAGGIEMRVVK